MFTILIAIDLKKEYQCEFSDLKMKFLKQIPELSSIIYQLDYKKADIYLEKYKPDILLSSMEYVIRYGIHNLKYACPGCKIIISTPNDRAENIIQLYNLGIFRYILQPSFPTHLIMTLQECIMHIKEEREREASHEQNIRFMKWVLWDSLLYELVTQPSMVQECVRALSGISFDLGNLQTAIVVSVSIGGLDFDSSERKQEVYFETRQFLQNLCGDYGIVFKIPTYRMIQLGMIYGDFSSMSLWPRQKLIDVLRKQAEHFTKGQSFWLKIGVGPQVHKLEDLMVSFEKSFDAMYLSFPFLRTVVVDCEQQTGLKQQLTLPTHMIQQLADSIDQPTAFEMKLNNLISYLNSQEVLLWGHLQIAAIQILCVLHKQDYPELSVQIAKIYTLSDLKKLLLSLSKYPDQKPTKKSLLIEKAKEIIYNQYSETGLSLQLIAQSLFISPSYLSSQFKKELGISLVEYLSMVRVEKARELCAQEEYKISQIARMVGYQDPGYFASCFKKIVGVSPSQYRKKLKCHEL